MLQDCKIVFDTDKNEYQLINTITNEGIPFGIPSLSKTKSVKKTSTNVQLDESEPKLFVEDNKVILNQKLIDLLQLNPGDSITVSYMKVPDVGFNPVLGKSETLGIKGNKLTKSNSFSYRGKAHDELIKFGTEFTCSAHTENNQLIVLHGNNIVQPETESTIPDPDQAIIKDLEQLDGKEFESNEVFDANDINSLLNNINNI